MRGQPSQGSSFHTGLAEALGEVFQEMMQAVTDVSDGHFQLVGNLLVFKVLKILHADHPLIPLPHLGNEYLNHANCLHLAQFTIGSLAGAFAIPWTFIDGLAFVFAEYIKRKITDAAEEPCPGNLDLAPMLVEFQKGVLHDFLGEFSAPEETVSEAQKRAFLIKKDLLERTSICDRFFLTGQAHK